MVKHTRKITLRFSVKLNFHSTTRMIEWMCYNLGTNIQNDSTYYCIFACRCYKFSMWGPFLQVLWLRNFKKKIKSKGFAYHIAIIYKINKPLDVGKGYLRNLFLVAIVLQAFCRNRPEITPARFIRYKARLGIKRWTTKNLIFHLKIGSWIWNLNLEAEAENWNLVLLSSVSHAAVYNSF